MGVSRQFRRRLLMAATVPVAGLLAFGVLSLDWRHRAAKAPVVVRELHAEGPIRVGAGRASLVPPFPTPVSGFNTRGAKPFHDVQSPLDARAIVIEVGGARLGLMSVETVALPAVIRAEVLRATADLKLDDLIVAATHAHSGVGGYWHTTIAEYAGLGPYDPKVEAFFVGQLVAALRQAAADLKPSRLTFGTKAASGFAYNRNDGNGAVDTQITSARFLAPDGEVRASLVVFAAHPTIINRVDMALSGDWPGALMRSIEKETKAPALFFQGALGDASWLKSWGETGQQTANRFGETLAHEADAALVSSPTTSNPAATNLGWTRVRIGLPACDLHALVPPVFGPITSNAFCWATGAGDTEVSVLRVGALALASVPGEPVAQLGIDWRRSLGTSAILSLADDYVGYVEQPSVMAAGAGETKRTYFGPELADRLFQGLRLASATAGKGAMTP